MGTVHALVGVGVVLLLLAAPYAGQSSAEPSSYVGWSLPTVLGTTTEENVSFSQPSVVMKGDLPRVTWKRIATDYVNNTRAGEIWTSDYFKNLAGPHWTSERISEQIQEDSRSSDRIAVPQSAVDGEGNVLVVWAAINGVWSSWYDGSEGTWQDAVFVGEGGRVRSLDVASDRRGNALALWSWGDSRIPGYNVVASWFTPETGWSAATSIGTGWDPRVEMNRQGHAVVGWFGIGPYTGYELYVNTFNATQGSWGLPKVIPTKYSGDDLAVATKDNGDGLVAWVNPGRFLESIFTVRFDAQAGTWDEAVAVAGPQEWIDLRALEMAANGDTMVIWRTYDNDIERFVMLASWYDASDSTWDEPVAIAYDAFSPSLALDARGNALVAWRQWSPVVPSTGVRDIVAMRFDASSEQWGTPIPLGGEHSGAPDVALASEGDFALVAWSESDAVLASWFYLDGTPPSLVLLGPEDGFITRVASVRVTGITEPGATLVVNGVEAALSADGSFTLAIALAEGANVVVVAATDPAGNVARLTVRVTYMNLVPALQDELLEAKDALSDTAGDLATADAGLAALNTTVFVLMVLQAAFAATIAALLVRNRTLVRRNQGPGRMPRNPGGPDPDPLPEANDEAPQSRVDGRGPSQNEDSQTVPWPRGDGLLHVTTKERILLHLLDLAGEAEAPQVPLAVTPGGIARAVGIGRRHLSQYVRPLRRAGLIRERTARVRGALQRRKVYLLTNEGMRVSAEVRTRVGSQAVQVDDGSNLRKATIEEVVTLARGSLSTLDIVRASLQAEVVRLGDSEQTPGFE